MEENKKKVIVPTIIAVVTLVLLTVGATYAYFKVATDNAFGTPKIEATTPSIGSVALSTGSNLTMNLTSEQMMQIVGTTDFGEGDYGLEDCLEDAESIGDSPFEYGCYWKSNAIYYATPDGTQTTMWDAETGEMILDSDDFKYKIGTATATGNETYNCTYTLTVDDNNNSLYDAYQRYNNKSNGQVVLTVNGVEYDFNTSNLFPLTIDGNMNVVNKNNPGYITARLRLLNSADVDQSNLSGQTITLQFDVEDFSCTAVEEPPLCIRAAELHEEIVDYVAEDKLHGDYWYGLNAGEMIKYGNLGIKGEEVFVGDALTCDVNGDGTYDEETERFYYVSDYYNTTTKEFESDKATLIYYKKTGDYVKYYATAKENWHGPVTAITQLPKTTEWTNVSLINPVRTIINEQGGSTNTSDSGVVNNLPTAFDYSGYSARLVTYQEIKYAFNNCSDMGCAAFKIDNLYHTETPGSGPFGGASNNYYYTYVVNGSGPLRLSLNAWAVRPVIEVYKTDIDY